MKGEKHVAQMDFAEYLGKSDVTQNKFIIVDFYEMDFMKSVVILVKVNEMCKMLKNLLTNRFWSRDGIA